MIGFTQILNNIIDEARKAFKPIDSHIALFLIRSTVGWHKNECFLTIKEIAAENGCSRWTVARTLKRLHDLDIMITKTISKRARILVLGKAFTDPEEWQINFRKRGLLSNSEQPECSTGAPLSVANMHHSNQKSSSEAESSVIYPPKESERNDCLEKTAASPQSPPLKIQPKKNKPVSLDFQDGKVLISSELRAQFLKVYSDKDLHETLDFLEYAIPKAGGLTKYRTEFIKNRTILSHLTYITKQREKRMNQNTIPQHTQETQSYSDELTKKIKAANKQYVELFMRTHAEKLRSLGYSVTCDKKYLEVAFVRGAAFYITPEMPDAKQQIDQFIAKAGLEPLGVAHV